MVRATVFFAVFLAVGHARLVPERRNIGKTTTASSTPTHTTTTTHSTTPSHTTTSTSKKPTTTTTTSSAHSTVPFCPIVLGVVSAAKAQSAATAFCSSYLHIPSSTVQSSPATVTVRTTISPAVTVSNGVSTETITGVCPNTPKARKIKRAASTPPACFSNYPVGTLLSSACSCLSITPATKTSVVGASATVTITVTNPTTVTVPSSTSTSTIAATGCAPPPIVTDGGFENERLGSGNTGSWTFAGDGGAFGEVVSNDGNSVQTPYGNQFAYLACAEASPSGSGTNVQQLVNLPDTATGSFTLTFAYSIPNNASVQGIGNLAVYVEEIVYSQDGIQVPQPWTTLTIPFTADSGSQILEFSWAPSVAGTVPLAILIDQVAIAPA